MFAVLIQGEVFTDFTSFPRVLYFLFFFNSPNCSKLCFASAIAAWFSLTLLTSLEARKFRSYIWFLPFVVNQYCCVLNYSNAILAILFVNLIFFVRFSDSVVCWVCWSWSAE